MNAVGINIYGGGFTLGALEHFDVQAQLEEIDLGKDTWDLNFGHTAIHRPLKLEQWNAKQYRGVEYVFANPPCAPWSAANMRPGFTNDKRFNDWRLILTKHTMDAGQEIKPQVFISESVENAYNIGASHYEQYIESWIKLGYGVTILLTDAILHGLPSTRRRFHFIAHQSGLHLRTPRLVNFKPNTVRSAIWDLKDNVGDPRAPVQHDLPQMSEQAKHWSKIIFPRTKIGGRACDAEKIYPGYDGPRSSFLVKRLMWDAPAFTMVGLSKLIHPDGKRFITWREGMRLMSYPDWYLARREIEAADAVTPLMGEYLSRIARDSIRKGERIKSPKLEIIDWRPLGKPYHIGVLKKALTQGI